MFKDFWVSDETSFGKGSKMLLKSESRRSQSFSPQRTASPTTTIRSSFLTSFIGDFGSQKRSSRVTTSSNSSSSGDSSKTSLTDNVDLLPPVVILESGQITPLETSMSSSDFNEQEHSNSNSQITDIIHQTESTEFKMVEKLLAIGQQSFDEEIIYESNLKGKKKRKSPVSQKAFVEAEINADDLNQDTKDEERASLAEHLASNSNDSSDDQTQKSPELKKHEIVATEQDVSVVSHNNDEHEFLKTVGNGTHSNINSESLIIKDTMGVHSTDTSSEEKMITSSVAKDDSNVSVDESTTLNKPNNVQTEYSVFDAHSAECVSSINDDSNSIFTHARKDSQTSGIIPVRSRSRTSSCASIQSTETLEKVKLADSWTQVTTPGPIFCIAQVASACIS